MKSFPTDRLSKERAVFRARDGRDFFDQFVHSCSDPAQETVNLFGTSRELLESYQEVFFHGLRHLAVISDCHLVDMILELIGGALFA